MCRASSTRTRPAPTSSVFSAADAGNTISPPSATRSIHRAEFLTAYGGDTYADLGKYQAIFEFQSMIGELVGFDMVSAPVYDWAGATTSALMMAARITGRRKVLIPGTSRRRRRRHIRNVASAQVDAVRSGSIPEPDDGPG